MTFDPHPFAARLLAARETGEPVPPLGTAITPVSRADAYAVQAIVNERIGPPGGFKTGPAGTAEPPIMAPIPRDCVRTSPAVFDSGRMCVVGVELEIAFRLERAAPDPEAPDFEEQLRASVSVLPAIEVVDSRLTDISGNNPIAKLADDQFGHGLVVGASTPLMVNAPLSEVEITFHADGEVLGSGRAKVPGGDAFATLVAFGRTVGNHCGGLKTGHVVTTGALCGLHFVDRNAEVGGTITGLGAVAVRFQNAP